MKVLHRENLFCWSQFDEARNIDFHSYFWVRNEGNIVFDPLTLTPHDKEHLDSLGGVKYIIISNSDHIRNAKELADETGASIWGPLAEKDVFPFNCSKWLKEELQVLVDLDVYSLQGSKTPGELAFVLEGDTLITGDLIRSHSGGKLCLLPDAKLSDRSQAIASVKKLIAIKELRAVLPGDGWPVFRNGHLVLQELIDSIKSD